MTFKQSFNTLHFCSANVIGPTLGTVENHGKNGEKHGKLL